MARLNLAVPTSPVQLNEWCVKKNKKNWNLELNKFKWFQKSEQFVQILT